MDTFFEKFHFLVVLKMSKVTLQNRLQEYSKPYTVSRLSSGNPLSRTWWWTLACHHGFVGYRQRLRGASVSTGTGKGATKVPALSVVTDSFRCTAFSRCTMTCSARNSAFALSCRCWPLTRERWKKDLNKVFTEQLHKCSWIRCILWLI